MSARVVCFALAASVAVCDLAAAQTPDSLNPMHALDKAGFANFVELPLFDPARRLPPPPPPAPEAVATAPPPAPETPAPALQLVGIIRGKRDLAVVHQNGAEKTVILRNGETLDGWTVIVNARSMTLKNGDRNADFALFTPGTSAAAPPAQAADPEGQPPQPRRHPDN